MVRRANFAQFLWQVFRCQFLKQQEKVEKKRKVSLSVLINGKLFLGDSFTYSGGNRVHVVIPPQDIPLVLTLNGHERAIEAEMVAFNAKGAFEIYPGEVVKQEKALLKKSPGNGPHIAPCSMKELVCQSQNSRQLSATFSNMMRYFHKCNDRFEWKSEPETVFKIKQLV